MRRINRKTITLFGVLLLMTACQYPGIASKSHSLARVESGKPTEYAKSSAEEKPEASYYYDYDTIYDLIIAEISARNSDSETTLNNYVHQSHFTQNPDIIHRAILYAEYFNKDDIVLDLALLWTEVEPNNIIANQIAANQLFKHLRFTEAAQHIDLLIANNQRPDLENILIIARLMDFDGKMQILSTIKQLTDKHPDQASLWYTQAILEVENSNILRAIEAIDKVIELDHNNIQAKLIKARTLMNVGSSNTLSYLKKVVREHPKEKIIRLLYAMALEDNNQLDKSIRQFTKLGKQFPKDNDLHLSLARVAAKAKKYKRAKKEFTHLLNANYNRTQVLFSLAEIAKHENNEDEAIAFYTQVTEKNSYLLAQISIANIEASRGNLDQAIKQLQNLRKNLPEKTTQLFMAEAQLLTEHNRLDQAYALLTTALTDSPANADLLYSRAMLGDKMDRLDILENDLMTILAMHPDSPMALNALGYTLANKTSRYEEAYGYISKAYSLQPDDPAVIDSMGWVEYRMGNTSAARQHLEYAFQLSTDHEIAAHYGEILWVTGNRQEAIEVWTTALDKQPHSKALNKVLEQFLPLRKN